MSSNIFSEFNGYFDGCTSLERNIGMKFEVLRLGSYLGTKVATSTIRLASAGFYATGNGDETKCYSCQVTHRGWKSTDNPVLLHRQMSVDCRHNANMDTETDGASVEPRMMPVENQGNSQPAAVQGTTNRHSNEDVTNVTSLLAAPFGKEHSSHSSTSFAAAASTSELRVSADKDCTASDALWNISAPSNRGNGSTTGQTSLCFDNAVYPHYSEAAERLKSFATWPKGHCKRPDDLVRVGLFYAGYSDCVRCYVCGVGLRTWEGEDDPWTEHVRWRSSCDYVASIKGPDFAIQTLAALGRENRNTNSNDTSKQSKLREDETGDILKTDECRRAVEMGFNSQQVKQAAMTITTARGRASLTLDVLIEKMITDENAIGPNTIPATQTQMTTFAHELQPIVSSDCVTDCEANEAEIEVKDCPGGRYSLCVTEKAAFSETGYEEKHKISDPVEVQADGEPPARSSGGEEMIPHTGYNSLPALSPLRYLDRESSTITEKKSKSLSCYSQTSDGDENRELKESSLCKVCLDEPANIVFLPCGHLVSCVTCSPALERCPLCRKHIRGTVRVYLANMKSVTKDAA